MNPSPYLLLVFSGLASQKCTCPSTTKYFSPSFSYIGPLRSHRSAPALQPRTSYSETSPRLTGNIWNPARPSRPSAKKGVISARPDNDGTELARRRRGRRAQGRGQRVEIPLEPAGGNGDADAGDQLAPDVPQRGGYAADALDVLLDIERELAPANRFEIVAELSPGGGRVPCLRWKSGLSNVWGP